LPGSWPDHRWVRAGFWQAYELVRDGLLGEVVRQAGRPSQARRVHATGFSLGGVLAQLAALDIAAAVVGTPVSLHTFAAPRAGDTSLNTLMNSRMAETWIVGFAGDPVIHLPPRRRHIRSGRRRLRIPRRTIRHSERSADRRVDGSTNVRVASDRRDPVRVHGGARKAPRSVCANDRRSHSGTGSACSVYQEHSGPARSR
jgi:hypothetical protein